MSSKDLQTYDRSAQERLHAATEALKNLLVSSERIVSVVHQIADYVPELNNSNYSKFWKEQVIPNLQGCLTQNVKLRSILNQFLSSIRAFAICVQNSADMIRKAKGSFATAKSVKQTITNNLNVLKERIGDISSMEYSAVQMLTNQIGQLNENINAEISSCETQKAQIMLQIEQRNQEEKQQISELQDSQDNLQNLCTLIVNNEKYIKDRQRELQERKNIVEQLVALNAEDEQTINSILVTNQEAYNTASFNGISSLPKKTSEKALNSYQTAEIRRLKTEISERVAQINEHNKHLTATIEILHNLNRDLRIHNNKYKIAMEEFPRSQRSYLLKIESIRNGIFELHQSFARIQERATAFDTITKRHNPSLTERLAEFETLKKYFADGTSLCSQLNSILSVLTEPIEASLALLTNMVPAEIYDSTQHLLKQAMFLSGYCETAKTAFQSTSN